MFLLVAVRKTCFSLSTIKDLEWAVKASARPLLPNMGRHGCSTPAQKNLKESPVNPQHHRSLSLLKKLATSWNQAAVRWVLLGRYSRDHVFEDDVDLAIHPEDLTLALALLQQTTDEHQGVITQVFRYEYNAFAVVVAQKESTGWGFVSIDICSEFRFDGRLLQSGAELVGARQQAHVEWLWLPSNHNAFAHYLLKSAAKRRFNEEGRSYLSSLDLNPRQTTEVILGSNAAKEIELWLSSSKPLKARALTGAFAQRYRHSISSRWREFRRFWLRLRKPKGLHVAITGPDGVGKSTVSELAQGSIGPCFRSLETAHLSLRTTTMDLSTRGVAPYTQKNRGLAASLLKTLVLVASFNRLFWRWIWQQKRKHGLFWSDRHFSDFIADPQRFRVSLPLWIRRLSWRFVPSPDLTIVLVASAETIQERCDEVNLEQTRHQVDQYEELARYDKSLYRISAEQSADQVADEIATAVIGLLARKHENDGWMTF